MKLYEISDQIERILATCVDPDTGEISEEASAQLDALDLARDTKALDVARYLLGERVEAQAVKAQSDRLAARARTHLRRAEWLERYLAQHIPPGHNVKDDTCRIRWRKSSGTVAVDEKQTPPAYLVPQPPKVDRAGILKTLRGGGTVNGWRLDERQKIQID